MKNAHQSRQSFLGPDSETIHHAATVAVIGLGGGGSHVAQQLAHVGVGNFEVFDPDRFEETNLNRLVGATFADINRKTPKTEIAQRVIKAINPQARVRKHACDWRDAAEYLRGCDAVFGCVDSFTSRSEIEVMCRRYLIPYIDIGMDVFKTDGGYCISGQVVLSMPGEMCMRCIGFLRDDLFAQEAAKYGDAGPRPQVIWPNGVLASTAVGLFIELITPWHTPHPGRVFLEYDGNAHAVSPSSALEYARQRPCPHFSERDLGDPFFGAGQAPSVPRRRKLKI
jgi:hypothetical protein